MTTEPEGPTPVSMPEPDTDNRDPVPPELIHELLEQSGDRERLGEGGLLAQLTKQLLETALETEMTDHLGYERGDTAGRGSGNSRNGSSRKRLHTDIGTVDLEVPRDRNGEFDPKIVPKHTRRLEGFNERIIALYARGMTVRDIQAHSGASDRRQVRNAP
jgi:putative transposase